ncbi:MAG: TIGR00730 family Rossman fold protein [Burkholderiales bacterium]|nr:TIGR00730 family Rossman fold protein [Burkholderiales bacterium]
MDTNRKSLKSICLFCGSSPGVDPAFKQAAAQLGTTLAYNNIRLIYGGGHVGLMGVAADACLSAGGEVVGVIPRKLMEKEVGHAGLTQMHVVETMHERKALMTQLCDGFIALPGGYGTLDELFEALTWQQLAYHLLPVGVLNVSGYFEHLVKFLDHARDERLLRDAHRDSLIVDGDLSSLIARMQSFVPPNNEKWLDRASKENIV